MNYVPVGIILFFIVSVVLMAIYQNRITSFLLGLSVGGLLCLGVITLFFLALGGGSR